jgi:hypothetical protein
MLVAAGQRILTSNTKSGYVQKPKALALALNGSMPNNVRRSYSALARPPMKDRCQMQTSLINNKQVFSTVRNAMRTSSVSLLKGPQVVVMANRCDDVVSTSVQGPTSIPRRIGLSLPSPASDNSSG